MTEEEFSIIELMKPITGYYTLDDYTKLVSYINTIDVDIVKSHKLDLTKVLTEYKDTEVQNINNTSIVISAAVTAYARIHITKLKMYILSKGGKLYYSDTDSIVTDYKLPNEFVDSQELGKLELEYNILEGIFISNKLYAIETDQKDKDGNNIIKIVSSCL